MAWLAAAAGAVLIVVVLVDAFEVMILPRRVRHGYRLSRNFYRYAWRFWRWRWTPGVAGRHTLTVRAVDGTGAVQTKDDYGITPAGASAWHSVSVFAVL